MIYSEIKNLDAYDIQSVIGQYSLVLYSTKMNEGFEIEFIDNISLNNIDNMVIKVIQRITTIDQLPSRFYFNRLRFNNPPREIRNGKKTIFLVANGECKFYDHDGKITFNSYNFRHQDEGERLSKNESINSTSNVAFRHGTTGFTMNMPISQFEARLD